MKHTYTFLLYPINQITRLFEPLVGTKHKQPIF